MRPVGWHRGSLQAMSGRGQSRGSEGGRGQEKREDVHFFFDIHIYIYIYIYIYMRGRCQGRAGTEEWHRNINTG